jgi:hypothetical protein
MIFLDLNKTLMRFFGFKRYLNEIFWFKWYLYETKSFILVYISSAPVISPIFTLNGENQTGTERYMNGTGKNQTRTERYMNGTAKGMIFNLAHACTLAYCSNV